MYIKPIRCTKYRLKATLRVSSRNCQLDMSCKSCMWTLFFQKGMKVQPTIFEVTRPVKLRIDHEGIVGERTDRGEFLFFRVVLRLAFCVLQ